MESTLALGLSTATELCDLCFSASQAISWNGTPPRATSLIPLGPSDHWGGISAPNWPGLTRTQPVGPSNSAQQRMTLRLQMPRWALYRRWSPASLAYRATPEASGEAVTLIALASRLQAQTHALIGPEERAALHELLAAQGWDDALRREEESAAYDEYGLDEQGRSLNPDLFNHDPQARLGAALVMLESLTGQTLTILTPCGEALRRSIAEEAGLIGIPRQLIPRRWTLNAPVPELQLELDQAAGLAALPWRVHWGAKDAVLQRYRWRSTWEGDWDQRGAQRDDLDLKVRCEGGKLHLSVKHNGQTFFATLVPRGEQTFS